MDNIRIMFLRGENSHPVGCLAMQLNGDTITYQVSTLNPVDKFNRRVARQLAIGRLIESPIKIKVSQSNIHDIVRFTMQHIITQNQIPARSRRAARIWLQDSNSVIDSQ